MALARCPSCKRHHRAQEPACPFCRAPRAAGALATGLAALALSGCPEAGPPPVPTVYGSPPAPVTSDAPTPPPPPTTEPEPAPPPPQGDVYGAPPPPGGR